VLPHDNLASKSQTEILWEQGLTQPESFQDIIKRLDNNIEYSKALKNEYDIDVVTEFYEKRINFASSSEISNIEFINNALHIELLRNTDENHYYAIHKIKNGGLLYTFFEATNIENDLKNLTLTCAAYSEKSANIGDFDNIKIGSTLTEVENIDTTTRFAKELQWEGNTQSLHLLTDGVLTISYHQEGNNFIVDNIKCQPDFIVKIEDNPTVYNYKILSQDYPN
jgi:hypothetical protein